jgi:hypothetical protein
MVQAERKFQLPVGDELDGVRKIRGRAMTRLRARRDLNHAEIRDAFRRLGWSVWDTAACGHGAPDLVCGKDGRNILVEVKSPGGVLTQDEADFSMAWMGEYITVRCLADVVRLTNG